MHHHTKGSKLLRKLREEPQINIDVPSPSHGTGLRDMVFKLSVSAGGSGDSKSWPGKSGSKQNAVYYLYGDERRAVRRYIKDNTEFVQACLEDSHNNPLRHNLPGDMFRLLEEEYEIMRYNNEL